MWSCSLLDCKKFKWFVLGSFSEVYTIRKYEQLNIRNIVEEKYSHKIKLSKTNKWYKNVRMKWCYWFNTKNDYIITCLGLYQNNRIFLIKVWTKKEICFGWMRQNLWNFKRQDNCTKCNWCTIFCRLYTENPFNSFNVYAYFVLFWRKINRTAWISLPVA